MWWFLLACASDLPAPVDSGTPDPFPADLVGDVEAGDDAFFLYCGTCHGPKGRGGIGPDLAFRVPGLDDRELYGVITEGRLPRMPPLTVTDQQAIDLVAWLRDRFGSARE